MDEYMIGNQSLVDNCVVIKAATLSYKTHPQLLIDSLTWFIWQTLCNIWTIKNGTGIKKSNSDKVTVK